VTCASAAAAVTVAAPGCIVAAVSSSNREKCPNAHQISQEWKEGLLFPLFKIFFYGTIF